MNAIWRKMREMVWNEEIGGGGRVFGLQESKNPDAYQIT